MTSPKFEVVAPFQPAGDQPKAIEGLTAGLHRGDRYQTLLGVTGSGKTMTLAHTIANYGKPTLVLSHNKTLAAQLYGELRQFLPRNAVEYFVSYYDYYQPEAYVPATDVYIEKDASINQDIESLRLRATSSLMEREDVVIVATVSAIYGLGDPVEYRKLMVTVRRGRAARPGRDPERAGPDPVRPQRRLVRAGHVSSPGRFDRDLPRLRRAGHPDRALGRRGRADQQDQPAHRRHDRAAGAVRHLPRQALRHRARRRSSGRCISSVPSWPSGWPSSRQPASCWRRSGSSRAPSSTSRCCSRWAPAPASRTTLAR